MINHTNLKSQPTIWTQVHTCEVLWLHVLTEYCFCGCFNVTHTHTHTTKGSERVTRYVVPCHLQLHYALVLLQSLQQRPATQQTNVVPPQICEHIGPSVSQATYTRIQKDDLFLDHCRQNTWYFCMSMIVVDHVIVRPKTPISTSMWLTA